MDNSCIIEYLMPESGIKKVENCMLCSSYIEVYRHPILLFFFIKEFLVVLWVDISEEIPTGTSPLRHCVGLSLGIGASYRALAVHPAFNICQWAFPCSAWLIFIDFWQSERKLVLWNRYSSTVRAVYKRNRLSPVSLA